MPAMPRSRSCPGASRAPLRILRLALLLVLLPGAAAAQAAAPVPPEPVGRVLALPPPTPHRVWIADLLFRRSALFDADTGAMLGMLSAGVGVIALDFAPERGEIYLAQTYYSRGSRGERTDVVTVYDDRTLAPVAEVEIPPRRADYVHAVASSGLLGDGRHWVVFNATPATSVSVVDVAARRFVAEIGTPGCTQVHPVGRRRFAMLCGDGTLLQVRLGPDGALAERLRSERFFDPLRDPVIEKGVRLGDRWLFVSFAGVVHEVDLSGTVPRFAEPWPLFAEAEREEGWQVGGTVPVALHVATGRLYVLVHRGGPGGHKDPGREIWVYELESRRRVLQVPVHNVVGAFVAQQMGVADGLGAWLARRLVPNPGVDSILVTPDDAPILVTASRSAGSVAVHDALTGAHLRDVHEVGLAPGLLQAFPR